MSWAQLSRISAVHDSVAFFLICSGSILESKGMHVIFQKKGKKGAKYLKI